jgi:hypothetical protein
MLVTVPVCKLFVFGERLNYRKKKIKPLSKSCFTVSITCDFPHPGGPYKIIWGPLPIPFLVEKSVRP